MMDETLPISMFGVFGLICLVGLDDLTKELATSNFTKFANAFTFRTCLVNSSVAFGRCMLCRIFVDQFQAHHEPVE